MTVVDDDRGIVFDPAALTVVEGDEAGVSFMVALATQPSGTVTVTVTGHQNSDVELAGLDADGALKFTDTDWSSPQAVTVTADHDADGTDDVVALTFAAVGGEYDGTTAEYAVTVVDDDRGFVFDPAALTVVEGDEAGVSYTVALATQPSETVTVTVTGHDGSDVRLAGLDADGALEFTTSNWATPQAVTVTAINDADDTDDVVALTFAAVGGEYEGTAAEYAVTVVDDDRGIVFTPAALEVVEGDEAGVAYTVALASQPSETVTVTVTGQQNSDVVLAGLDAGDTLEFTTSNWATPQTVTVTADHDVDDTDDMVTLIHSAVGGEYEGTTAEYAVTVVDDDRGIVFTPTSLTVVEGDEAGVSFMVALATQPSGTVTVTVTGQQNTDVVLAGLDADGALKFTDTDWSSPQAVTVTADHDADGTDDVVALTFAAVGGEYDGTTAEYAVTVVDDDRGIVFTPEALTVGEDATASFMVKLATQPSETVTVTVLGHDGSDVRLAGLDADGALEFTTSNWATPQAVTVTAINDVDDTDDMVALTFAAVGGGYDGTTAEYAVTVVDDDRGIVFDPAALTVVEGDEAGVSFMVALATQPSGTVTVTVTGHQNSDVELAGLDADGALKFTDTDWSSPQAVTVTADHDADGTDDVVALTFAAVGGEYDGTTAEYVVTVVDDDRGFVFDPAALTVVEGDEAGVSFMVALATQPSETVTVTVTGHDGSDVRLAGLDADGALEFTTSNWATPQAVTVTAINDADDTDDVVALTFAAVGGEYEGTAAEYAVTVVDDDRGIVFTPAALDCG